MPLYYPSGHFRAASVADACGGCAGAAQLKTPYRDGTTHVVLEPLDFMVRLEATEQALDRKQRDPVAPAEPSTAVKSKKAARATENGLPIHSFKTLMAEMGTRCHHRCRVKSDPECPPIFQDTDPTPLQARALELTRLLPVQGI